jgi:peptidoglycan/xylan/chitin deacetylase (PgdA/CDA1 family)
MAALKRLAEYLMARGGPAALARRHRADSTLVLAYHNIIPEGERGGADRSLHLPQRSFAAQLDQLAHTHEITPLEDLLTGPPARTRRPRAVLTFDDGSMGAVTAGVTELRRRGLPATLFVTPGRLGRHAFWWDRLGSDDTGEVPPDLRSEALTRFRGEDAAIVTWAGPRAAEPATVPECARTATVAELDEALRVPGITVASHTWSHPNLAALEVRELEEELARPLAWLRARWPAALPAVSYPYGLSSPGVADAAKRAGYRAGFVIAGGWLASAAGSRAFALPRLNVPAGVSPEGFALRTSGLLGV